MNTDTTGTTAPRVWLVTGASSGFGRAITEAALAAGDSVAGAVRRPGALDDLAKRHPDRLATIELDVTDTAAAPGAVAAAVDRFGRIDVLVNNAGRALIGAAEETTDAELRELMDVHFFGPAALVRAVLPVLRRQRSGAIVQISSMGGRLAFAGVSAYSATKFALEGYSEALAAELAPFGITVLIVEPGAFRTGLHGGAMRMSAVNPAYDDVVGPVRAMQDGFDGAQPGDPAKAAAAIRAALDAENPPLRLPLGNDAADAVDASLNRLRAEFDAWETASRGTDLDPDR
ncbi:oxidoreductase [Jiangella asiatica]|uniref:SDR family NAD(P)-dependent oxidoreductase n=1 Tax=Jiangella asiatica TaxID=2530372 RepID=A0A4R5DVE2_9ACTN|nr:oxidoreductase [Jiangella asiatica]TDE14993.1 SDR family NAD(P)-dependent oxidoreductase [Jiangella asiatica]